MPMKQSVLEKVRPNQSYLRIPRILSACEITGADAIHPGYGFLSENGKFASICASCGITFIGPCAKAIELLGDKAQAKRIAKDARCPVIPGCDGIIETVDQGLQEAKKIGFPVFIKASAGGGGKGIRIAKNEHDFMRQVTAARTEAEASFGNPAIYIEKMITNPRHIENTDFGRSTRQLYSFRGKGLYDSTEATKINRGNPKPFSYS